MGINAGKLHNIHCQAERTIMSYLLPKESPRPDDCTYILFRKVGTYVDGNGVTKDALVPLRKVNGWSISVPSWRSDRLILNEDEVIMVTRHDIGCFLDCDEIKERRDALDILTLLTHYTNRGDVLEADDLKSLDSQLRFPWRELMENYRSILSEDDENENKARNTLMAILGRYRSGNMKFMVQEYLDAVDKEHGIRVEDASKYLHKFIDEGFVKLTEYFSIREGKSKEYLDSHFETRPKSGRW